MLSSKIELLMHRTFAFQLGESSRQQRLISVLPYVMLWSNRRANHLSKNDGRSDPPPRGTPGKDPGNAKDDAIPRRDARFDFCIHYAWLKQFRLQTALA